MPVKITTLTFQPYLPETIELITQVPSPLCIRNPNLVTNVPNNTRSSEGIVLVTKFDIFSSSFLRLSYFPNTVQCREDARGPAMCRILSVNMLRPRQNDHHFPSDNFKYISLNGNLEFRLGFHWDLFTWFELTIFQHWCREWLGADQTTSHYLNQWWLVYWRIYTTFCLNDLLFC